MIRIVAALLIIFAVGIASAEPHEFTLKLGLLMELSGPSATNGENCRKGLETAQAAFASDGLIGQSRLRLIYGDNKGEAKSGVTEFRKLIQVDGTLAVITTRSQVAMALNPISHQMKVPLLGPIGHAQFVEQNPLAFRFWPSTRELGRKTAEIAFNDNLRKAAIISYQDEYAVSLRDAFTSHFKSLGGVLLFDEVVDANQTDFSSIASSIRRVKPEVIFANLGLSQIGLVIKKLREQGLTQQILSSGWTAHPEVLAVAGKKALQRVRYVDFDFNKPAFAQKLFELYPGTKPLNITYTCYLALGSLLQVLRNNPNISDSKGIYQVLSETSSVELLDGRINLVDREAQFDLVVKEAIE